ncbi:rod shape-determining protein MreD [Candidatus Roizmanbacteria bacterium]|nr:rod shape-determining protein MreD [Candidatus Roizmanbacteria bacterium]
MIILLLVIIFSTFVDGMTALTAAFLAGLVVDLWNGDQLGITSLVFILVALLLNVYKRKYDPEHLVFLLPFTVLVVTAYSWFDQGRQFVRSALLADIVFGSVGIVLVWLVIRLWKDRYAAKG